MGCEAQQHGDLEWCQGPEEGGPLTRERAAAASYLLHRAQGKGMHPAFAGPLSIGILGAFKANKHIRIHQNSATPTRLPETQ